MIPRLPIKETMHGGHNVWCSRWIQDGKRRRRVWGRVRKGAKRRKGCKGSGISLAAAERKRDRFVEALTLGTESLERPDKVTLGQFTADYPDRRRQGGNGRGYLKQARKLADKTIADHMMTLRYMIQHFGPNRDMNAITFTNAVAFVEALAADKLAGARKKSGRKWTTSQPCVHAHIRHVKAIFTWAVLLKVIESNPFTEFRSDSPTSDDNHYVTLSEFRRLYRAAPSQGFKLLYALCRLGGCRRGEALALPWSGHANDSDGKKHWVGIDWDRHRICIVGDHKMVHKYREAPIRPLLYRLLLKAFDAAEAGPVTITGLGPANYNRIAKKTMTAAGLAPWANFHRALRSSWENDHKLRGVAETTYCSWSGHSPDVSRKHYVAPTAQEFAAVAKLA